MKIHTGDTVVVITGKDKGKTGKVLRLLPRKNRLVIEQVNMRTRHIKKTPQRAGQKIRYEASIDVSNVMIVDPKSKKRSRIGYEVGAKGKKRIAKKSGEVISGVGGRNRGSDTKKNKTEPEPESRTRAKKRGKKSEATSKEAPIKKPFWSKMGFGADAIAQGDEVKEPSHMSEDHSVPAESQLQSPRRHSRGS